jgi:diguanylate cyclase (GGDEF)-like protein
MRTLKVTALTVAIALVPVSVGLVLVGKRDDRQAAVRALTRAAAGGVAGSLGTTSGSPSEVRGALQQAGAPIDAVSLAVVDAQGHLVAATGPALPVSALRTGSAAGKTVTVAHPSGQLHGWTVLAAASEAPLVSAGDTLPIILTLLALALLVFVLTRRSAAEAGPVLADRLTGLGNRRRLELDLEALIPKASETEPILLALLDLEGFKTYNDSFGRTAGDALLSRLGKNLAHAVEGRGTAYRMGGDEFCVVVRVGADGQAPVLADAAAALSERGDGFAIASDQGTVLLPKEAGDVAAALRIADQRLYAGKASDTRSAGRQSADVLLQALYERSPELGSHLHDVALTAKEVGKRLGMSGEELDQIAQAAELHDVGKMAIPDAILKKPGPLDHEEWEFIRGHTIIGERIVSAAPALAPVAKLIRSSHERFNGTGYPDSLKGDEIPLGARVVAVCDAYDAMIGPRPYRLGLSKEDAISELRRCAGAQFDPVVVDVFCQVVDDLDLADDEDEAVIASRRH